MGTSPHDISHLTKVYYSLKKTYFGISTATLSFGAPPVSGTAGAQLSLSSASEKILAVIGVFSDLSICIHIYIFFLGQQIFLKCHTTQV